MMNIIGMYLLIGVAHSVAHFLICAGCKQSVKRAFFTVVDSGSRSLLWPIYAFGYLGSILRPRRNPLGGTIVRKMEMSPNPGESPQEFRKRVIESVTADIESEMKKREKPEGTS